jgi:hypothetical protein
MTDRSKSSVLCCDTCFQNKCVPHPNAVATFSLSLTQLRFILNSKCYLSCHLLTRLASPLCFRYSSELAELVDASYEEHFGGSDFVEGMKSVLDAVHPGLSSPDENGDYIPTHLITWHGGPVLKKKKKQRVNSLSPRSSNKSSSSSSTWKTANAGRQQ